MDSRSEFRRFVRVHHPDAGGDPNVFISGVAAYRRGLPLPADSQLCSNIVFYRKPHGVGAIVARINRMIADRQRPPRVR